MKDSLITYILGCLCSPTPPKSVSQTCKLSPRDKIKMLLLATLN